MTADYLEHLQGVAFYDERGLPQKIITQAEQSISWTEQSFHILSLQKLISQVLHLPAFDYGSLVTKDYTIVVVRQSNGYVACIQRENLIDRDKLVSYLQTLSPETVESHHKFVSV
jgi:hypothetical protein